MGHSPKGSEELGVELGQGEELGHWPVAVTGKGG